MKSDRPSKPPALWHNLISMLGLVVAIVSTAIGLPLMFIDLFSGHTHPYLGVVIYLVLPVGAVFGVAVVLLGVVWERRRRRRPGASSLRLPSLDLNQPKHQAIAVGALAVTVVLVVLLSVTGYRAYHFTESVQFCGQVCHQVMKPEFTAYQHSPHARVACVQCHVGPGAGWFVRSKLSGLYQVYSAAANKYPRPIPTPIKNLRPAQETCEQCHWPAKFFGAQQKSFAHYLTDETNTPWRIEMLIKVGGGDPKSGAAAGIHWHMNIKNKVEYIAADERREVIPWVRVTDPEGKVTEYMSTESPLTPEQIAKAEIRRMDCIDCHNRPSHIYRPPDRAVEQAMDAGQLDSSLPYLKREAVRLLIAPYASEEEAKAAILKGLAEFYQREYPEVYRDRAVAVRQATEALQQIYSTNFFPEMKVSWQAYPNHIGHFTSDGCYRCHDGLHKSAEGKIVTKDCNACHTILAQGSPEGISTATLQSQPFRHPVDMGFDVSEAKCSMCHTGTAGL